MADLATYVVGGNVAPGAGTYIERAADRELLEACRTGEYAYILAPRQVGKTSVMGRTAARLRQEGTRTVEIDLSPVQSATADEWYRYILYEIASQLDLNVDVVEWWDGRGKLPYAHRFLTFLEEAVVQDGGDRTVISVDEIDASLGLPFADDFFAAVRFAYQERARNPRLNNLSFVLIGSASPTELISDPKRTPFNIGRRIELTDFTEREAAPLASGLGIRDPERARDVLHWILGWTGGHPYLTQKVCYEFRKRGLPASEIAVDGLVEDLFLGSAASKEINLQTVRDMLTKRHYADPALVLGTYRDILRGRRVRDEERSPVKAHLKLTGVVKRDGDFLVVRNRIYERVFDEAWVEQNIPSQTKWERQVRRLAGIAVLAILGLLILGGITSYIYAKGEEAERARKAEAAANVALQKALDGQKRATQETAEALKNAEDEKQAKIEALAQAESARRRAEEEAQREKALAQRLQEAVKKADQATAKAQKSAEDALVFSMERDHVAEEAGQAKRLAYAEAAKANQERDRAEASRRTAAIALSKSLAAQVKSDFSSMFTAADVNENVWRALYSIWVGFEKDRIVTSEALQAIYDVLRWLPLADGEQSYAPPSSIAIGDDGRVTALNQSQRDYLIWLRLHQVPKNLSGPGGIPPMYIAHALDDQARYFAGGDAAGHIDVWNLTANEANLAIRIEAGKYPIQKLVLSPGGRFIAVSNAVQVLQLFDWRVHKEAWHRPKEPTTARVFKAREPFSNRIMNFAFNSSGDEIAVAFENTLQFFDTRDGKRSRGDMAESDRAVAFSGQGLYRLRDEGVYYNGVDHAGFYSLLAASSGGQLVVAAGAQNCSVLAPFTFDLPEFDASITAIAADSKGSQFVTGDSKGRIRIWSVAKMASVTALQSLLPGRFPVAFEAEKVPNIIKAIKAVLKPLTPEQCEKVTGVKPCPVLP